jgi:hypothetical protein
MVDHLQRRLDRLRQLDRELAAASAEALEQWRGLDKVRSQLEIERSPLRHLDV